VVKGTFDDPPVVIRQDRLKISLICLAMAVLIVLLYWRHPPSDDRLVWWLPLGLLAALISWSVIARGALILAPEGLVWRMAFLTFARLARFWELPPQRIADVLNEARTRWGPKGAAS